MTESRYYVLVTISLVGILMNVALFIHLGERLDKLMAVLEDRAK